MHESNPTTNPEYAADMAIKSNAVPAQFVREDGSYDREGLVSMYAEANSPTEETTTPVAANTEEIARAAAEAAVEAITPTTPQTTMSEMIDAAEALSSADIWSRVEAEARSGSVSDATLADLRAAGVPNSVINQYTAGIKAQAAARTNEAANAVGGIDNLKAVMSYAKSKYDPTQIKAQLNSPLWEATLRGLAAEAGIGAPSAKAPTPSTSGPAAAPSTEAIAPFNSQREMVAAIKDPRYQYDTDYQRWVQARIRVNAGF